MTDYYAILGVPRNATSTEIRDAYLKLARETHPDTVKDPATRKKAEDAFKNVTAAYDTLSRDRSRKDYTSRLPTASETKAPSPPKAAPPVSKGPPLGPRPAQAPAQTNAPEPARSAPIATGAVPKLDVLAQGIEAYKNQDYHTAVQLLNIAVTNDDKNAKAHAMLSLSLAKNPNWVRDALHHMEAASKLEPKNVSYLAEMALLLQSQGLKLRARRALESAIALSPDHPDVARALKEIPLGPAEPAAPSRTTAETARSLFDRFRKR
jgi:tetratricopeptide (TPR) repeat protein